MDHEPEDPFPIESGQPTCLLLDLGGTLASYYTREQFPPILRQAVEACTAFLRLRGFAIPPAGVLWDRVRAENYESVDHRVRPLAGRLERIFGFGHDDLGPDEITTLCRHFLTPIFARGEPYPDAIPTLRQLHVAGFRTALVSNSPWGSPSSLWREEVARLGLAHWLDVMVFCGDVGWRKPAPGIFYHTLKALNATSDQCVFVGDDPRWDIDGPRSIGMSALLINRGNTACVDNGSLKDLHELLRRLC